MIDVKKLAEQAGMEFRPSGAYEMVDFWRGQPEHLEAFAALVLDEVAKQFDQPHMEYFGSTIQETIDAMKPKGPAC
jgi:hypothetical protein